MAHAISLSWFLQERAIRRDAKHVRCQAHASWIEYPRSVDPNGLLASLFISSIGLVTFLYGKKQGRVPQLVIGLVLVVYTYFLSSVIWMFVIAAFLLGL